MLMTYVVSHVLISFHKTLRNNSPSYYPLGALLGFSNHPRLSPTWMLEGLREVRSLAQDPQPVRSADSGFYTLHEIRAGKLQPVVQPLVFVNKDL